MLRHPNGSSAVSNLSQGQSIRLPDGSRRVLPKNWSEMTVGDLAGIGLRPGQHRAGTAPAGAAAGQHKTATVPATVAAAPEPPIDETQSARGCNQGICIYLGGSGLQVNSWETTANTAGRNLCTYAAYFRGYNNIEATSNQICGRYSSVYAYRYDMPKIYSDRDQLCNTWVNFAGKPCKQIQR